MEIFLTRYASVASCATSKLKLIKIYLRSTMSQSRFVNHKTCPSDQIKKKQQTTQFWKCYAVISDCITKSRKYSSVHFVQFLYNLTSTLEFHVTNNLLHAVQEFNVNIMMILLTISHYQHLTIYLLILPWLFELLRHHFKHLGI